MKNLIIILISFTIFSTLVSCSRQRSEAPTSVSVDTSLTLISQMQLGISEPSGLFYNPATNTLLTVSDAHEEFYEISLNGEVLKTVTTSSSDPEGITLSQTHDTVYIAEERNYQITAYLMSGTRLKSWKLVTSSNPKHGYEGVTLNEKDNFVILNEKLPCLLVEIDKNGTELRRKELIYTSDISDIFYDKSANCYWLVSDEAQKILKLGPDWSLIKSWSIPVTQAEGITIVNDRIYVVSDPEAKMYVFKKPE